MPPLGISVMSLNSRNGDLASMKWAVHSGRPQRADLLPSPSIYSLLKTNTPHTFPVPLFFAFPLLPHFLPVLGRFVGMIDKISKSIHVTFIVQVSINPECPGRTLMS